MQTEQPQSKTHNENQSTNKGKFKTISSHPQWHQIKILLSKLIIHQTYQINDKHKDKNAKDKTDQQSKQKKQQKSQKQQVKILTLKQIKNILTKFNNYTIVKRKYFQRFKSIFSSLNFDQLFKAYKQQLPYIYSSIAQFIIQHQQINRPNNIPIFYQNHQQTYNISKTDVLFIICSMATFLIAEQQYHMIPQLQTQFNHLKDFGCIFANQDFKTKCVINYINKQLSNYNKNKIEYSKQILTIKRSVLKEQQFSIDKLIQKKIQYTMKPPQIVGNKVSIQEYNGHLKVDFANKYIGGGSLHGGNVQQQIMFSVHPQLFITPILCQVMRDNQALIMIGFKKYFNNRGYGGNVQFNGQNHQKYQIQEILQTQQNDKQQQKIQKYYRVKEYIVGIDAIWFSGNSLKQQFEKRSIDRQILKAYAGFIGIQQKINNKSINVVTGNWGCGVFNGTHCLKFLIQWIASSLSGKKMIYCPFGQDRLLNDKWIIKNLTGKSIKEVYQNLIKASKKVNYESNSIYQQLYKVIQNK